MVRKRTSVNTVDVHCCQCLVLLFLHITEQYAILNHKLIISEFLLCFHQPDTYSAVRRSHVLLHGLIR